MTFRPAKRDHNIPSLDKSNFAQSLMKSSHYASGLTGRSAAEKADHRHRLLRARCERPRGCRAAEQRDDLPPLHSITSSAVICMISGTVRPSALAVSRLITNSYLVGVCTGKSAGFSPLRIRSTYEAERRTMSMLSGP